MRRKISASVDGALSKTWHYTSVCMTAWQECTYKIDSRMPALYNTFTLLGTFFQIDDLPNSFLRYYKNIPSSGNFLFKVEPDKPVNFTDYPPLRYATLF